MTGGRSRLHAAVHVHQQAPAQVPPKIARKAPRMRQLHSAVTAETAVRLGLAFDLDPQFWLNLQAQYDIDVIQRDQGAQLAEEVHPLAGSVSV